MIYFYVSIIRNNYTLTIIFAFKVVKNRILAILIQHLNVHAVKLLNFLYNYYSKSLLTDGQYF